MSEATDESIQQLIDNAKTSEGAIAAGIFKILIDINETLNSIRADIDCIKRKNDPPYRVL